MALARRRGRRTGARARERKNGLPAYSFGEISGVERPVVSKGEEEYSCARIRVFDALAFGRGLRSLST